MQNDMIHSLGLFVCIAMCSEGSCFEKEDSGEKDSKETGRGRDTREMRENGAAWLVFD